MNTNNTSNLPKARISRLSRKDIESYQEALGFDKHSEELVAEFAVAHVKAHALQTEIYRRIASGNKRNVTVKASIPNAERARIIAKAKEFTEEYADYPLSDSVIQISEQRSNRKIIASIVSITGVRFTTKRVTVKTHPDDVYNFHIGKAIALGRLLGKDVSEFENAPQPMVALGQSIEVLTWYNESTGNIRKVTGIMGNGSPMICIMKYATHYKIIDDTDAIYEVSDNV